MKWSKFTAFQPQQTCTQQLGIVASVSVVDDGHGNPLLYFHSSDGYLYKLNGTDGSQIWRALVQIPSPTANDVFAWSSPTVANGKVIVGIAVELRHAVHARPGAGLRRWNRSPAVGAQDDP